MTDCDVTQNSEFKIHAFLRNAHDSRSYDACRVMGSITPTETRCRPSLQDQSKIDPESLATGGEILVLGQPRSRAPVAGPRSSDPPRRGRRQRPRPARRVRHPSGSSAIVVEIEGQVQWDQPLGSRSRKRCSGRQLQPHRVVVDVHHQRGEDPVLDRALVGLLDKSPTIPQIVVLVAGQLDLDAVDPIVVARSSRCIRGSSSCRDRW